MYRLIDPRNGETFYVGKGRGDRIFQHAKGALAPDKEEDALDLKSQRIMQIRAVGLEVGHVVHRHGIADETVAFEVEAALIDAYPGLANRIAGRGTDDYGVRHVSEIVADYAAEPFVAREPLILISIGKSFDDITRGSIYHSVRGCWKMSASRAKKFNLVLGHHHGLVRGAFRPHNWLPATPANFPWLTEELSGRTGFVGVEAEPEVAQLYVNKRVPDLYRARGAANPVRFVEAATPERS